MTSNNAGTDHGWGSHHFVLGGAVQGGKFYGNGCGFSGASSNYGLVMPSLHNPSTPVWHLVAKSQRPRRWRRPHYSNDVSRSIRRDAGELVRFECERHQHDLSEPEQLLDVDELRSDAWVT